MTKILIETTGEFELVDFSQSQTGLIIRHDRPTVSADNSSFVSQRAAVGQIKVLGNVNDEATDEEFQKYWDESKEEVKHDENATDEEKAEAERKANDKRKELAVAAFIDSHATSKESETAKVAEEPKNEDNQSSDSFTSTSASAAPAQSSKRGRNSNAGA